MTGKREYIDVLKALDRNGTFRTTLNLLSVVQLATEDVTLARRHQGKAGIVGVKENAGVAG